MAVIISGKLLIKAESRWDTQSAAYTRIISVIFLQEVNYCSGGHRCFCGLFTSWWQPDMMTHWSSCLTLTAKEHPKRSLHVTQLNETSGVCCLAVTHHPRSSSTTKKKQKLSTHQKVTAWQETKTQRFSFLPSGRCSVGPPACLEGDKNKFTSAPVCCLQRHQVGPSVELRHVAHTLPEEQEEEEEVTDEKDGLPFCQGNSLAG